MSDHLELVSSASSGATGKLREGASASSLNGYAPDYGKLKTQLSQAAALVDDIVLKNYLSQLSDLEVVPLDDSLCRISDIRLFKITEMVYQKDEYSTYKFASVFNAVQNLNCGVFVVADSDGNKTTFYMGVRSFENKRSVKSLKDTLRNALKGQFPGVKTTDLLDSSAEELLSDIEKRTKNIAVVSCVANDKDSKVRENEKFLQGLEKLALAMQGQRYTAVILANSVSSAQLAQTRRAYELIYTNLSPFSNMQVSYGVNQAFSISETFSTSTTRGTSQSESYSKQTGTSHTQGTSTSDGSSRQNVAKRVAVEVGLGLLNVASIVSAPLTGGLSFAAAGAISAGAVALRAVGAEHNSVGHSKNESFGSSESQTKGTTNTVNESESRTQSNTSGTTSGQSNNTQLTVKNKTLLDTLDKIDRQLKRLDECESMGMWECAAYFLSDSQETAEMAAGTYKALMRGEKSGVETSAINLWTRRDALKLSQIRKYVTNFIHPVFKYESGANTLPVSAASLISGNELAIQMGLPRKSVCGFPVIEHADFGKEVIRYSSLRSERDFILGNIFSMGSKTGTEVRLSRDSLTMHTFVTGSTGAGKSNTVYEILNQLRNVYSVPFLVIEPAKGEYKNVFGQFPDVTVYGTNPKKFSNLLRLNPFRFPSDVHILEHLDRLVEIFNVCWPMYAAMPAVLKEAIENAYIKAGWNVTTSENPNGEIYPNFTDILEQIEQLMKQSSYSADTKGDYSGALCTRVRSLTNGLNGMIFCQNDLTDAELFDRNAIVDLSRIGSVETKALIMGLLVMKLNEYRMTSGRANSSLTHITVLEEAHNLLKRTSTEQSGESANLLGKSVELLANSIAEMRTYGEGFVIADQSPGLLDMSVIRNTNTKIILRLPEQSDRELVGLAANLNKEQIQELSKLERGVAAVYQNDWVEPILVQVNKCGIRETAYEGSSGVVSVDPAQVKRQLLSLMIQGQIEEKLEFDVDELERNLDVLSLSTQSREFMEGLIREYRSDGSLKLWQDENFGLLSRRVTDLLNLREQTQNEALTAKNFDELTQKLKKDVCQAWPEIPKQALLRLIQCLMCDFSMGENNSDSRKNIYRSWLMSRS